jgi:hypothetical protein
MYGPPRPSPMIYTYIYRFNRQVSASSPSQTTDSVRYGIRASALRRLRCAICSISETDILQGNVEAWMDGRATNIRCSVASPPLRVPREVDKCNVGDLHLRRPGVGAVVAAILVDGGPDACALDEEVLEADVLDNPPRRVSIIECGSEGDRETYHPPPRGRPALS